MNIYREFALLYAAGQYTKFSATVAELLPSILTRLKASPRDLLDVACGDGTFAVRMAKKGFRVTGVDQSRSMLGFAKRKAEKASVHVNLIRRDMRFLQFEQNFDLVTCWFDSLNYLLKMSDLETVFKGIYTALREHGLFIFDMNTIYALSKLWQQHPATVELDRSQYFCVHRPSYDKRRSTATLRITGFVRRDGTWSRIDEEHHERGYSLAQIKRCLKTAGLKQLALWGSIRKMSAPTRKTRRVWFVAQRDSP